MKTKVLRFCEISHCLHLKHVYFGEPPQTLQDSKIYLSLCWFMLHWVKSKTAALRLTVTLSSISLSFHSHYTL